MKIIIKGPPIAKKRHKCACRGKHAIAYDPQIKEDMQDIRKEMLKAWTLAYESKNPEIAKEAICLTKAESFVVTYTFLFPINKSEALGPRNAKLWGFKSHNIKPDIDNLEKLYSDCAKGIIWQDDSQISICHSKKCYSENPRTEIEIMVKEDLKLDQKLESVFSILGPNRMEEFLDDIFHLNRKSVPLFNWITSMNNNGENREYAFKTIGKLLTDFSAKYLNDMKKISKIKIEDSPDGEEIIKDIEEGKFDI